MDGYAVRPLPPDHHEALAPLVEASVEEGFRFLVRLREEQAGGASRFDGVGEILLGVFRGVELVAVGGVNRDPHSGRPRTGRIRHVYVLPSARRAGVGRLLIGRLVAQARSGFDSLVLRTDTAEAARFYEALGFVARPDIPGATHHMPLGSHRP